MELAEHVMWPEYSFVRIVNLEKKFTIIPEMSNFSQGDYFLLACPVRINKILKYLKCRSMTIFDYLFEDVIVMLMVV